MSTTRLGRDRERSQRARTPDATRPRRGTRRAGPRGRDVAADHRSEPDGAVWRALADPTRRALLDRLRAGPLTTGRLAEGFPMTRFGVMKHLRVLVEAGLVIVEERGRERWHHIDPVPIRRLQERWLRPFAAAAAEHLEALRAAVEGHANAPGGVPDDMPDDTPAPRPSRSNRRAAKS
jgi:DNA-binding transcriptional ArsR family regulator